MFEPLFKVHTTVGMILNGFLKTTATVCVLFAAISTAPVVPDCVLLFYNVANDRKSYIPSHIISNRYCSTFTFYIDVFDFTYDLSVFVCA